MSEYLANCLKYGHSGVWYEMEFEWNKASKEILLKKFPLVLKVPILVIQCDRISL